ncbi:MAG: mechanosensitive ion channel protein MscS [Crocinitomicaceae bacterium]|nr:mechanosensitive ion channel protein MscS [Crocinitomicaceae bacterium]
MDFINRNHLIAVVLVMLLASLVSYVIRRYLTKFLDKSTDHLKVDPTRYNFLKNGTTAIIMGSALAFAFYAIPSLRSLGATLFAGAGIAAAILAFASQQAMSNVINGIFLVIFKPFRVGDVIKIGTDHFGIVEDITLRHTIIKSFENRRIIMPNAVIGNETIINSNIKDEKICRFIEFGISYDSNYDLAKSIIQEEAIKHPDFIDNRNEEQIKNGDHPLVVRMISHGDFSIGLRAYFWVEGPIKAMYAHFDLLESVKKRFDAEGIEIPFPYRTIVYKNDLKNKK